MFLQEIGIIYYKILKNPFIKLILGNLFIVFAFTIVGCNGKLIRNLSIYQDNYNQQQECRQFMNYIPDEILINYGCSKKYLNLNKEEICPNQQLTQIWENDKNEFGCLNWNCCGIISQVLLQNYITYNLMTNLIVVLLIELTIILFQIKQISDDAISQTVKQVALFISLFLLIAGCITYNYSPNIDIYRKTYVQQQDYISINNVVQMPEQVYFNKNNWLPQQCSQTISKDILNNIDQISDTEIELIFSITSGTFLIENINDNNIKIVQFQENNKDNIYIQGLKQSIIIIVENEIKICIQQADATISIYYNNNKNMQNINLLNHLNQNNGNNQQIILSQLLKYITLNIQSFYKGEIKLYNQLLYNCNDQNQKTFMILKIENETMEQNIVFYNFPLGQYGTLIFENNNIKNCIYFQPTQNLYIQPIIPQQSKITITLQWQGNIDLDLIIETDNCKVGNKYNNNCGEIIIQKDSIKGNINENKKELDFGEQILINYLTSYTYRIYVERFGNSKISLQESNAQVQLFYKNIKSPQSSVSIRQFIDNQPNKKWFVGEIKEGQQFITINKLLQ